MQVQKPDWARRQRWRRAIAALLIGVSLVALGLGTLYAEGPEMGATPAADATLSLSPSNVTIESGQTMTIAINVGNVEDLYGADVRLSFNPAILQVQDADAGRGGVQITPGTAPYPDFIVVNTADNAAGTAAYAVTQMSPREPFGGGGTVASITFRGLAAGTSAITISYHKIVTRNGDAILCTASNGEAVVGAGGATQTPTVTDPTLAATATPTQEGPTSMATATRAVPSSTATAAQPVATATPLAPTGTPPARPTAEQATPAPMPDATATEPPATATLAAEAPVVADTLVPTPSSEATATPLLPTATHTVAPGADDTLAPTAVEPTLKPSPTGKVAPESTGSTQARLPWGDLLLAAGGFLILVAVGWVAARRRRGRT